MKHRLALAVLFALAAASRAATPLDVLKSDAPTKEKADACRRGISRTHGVLPGGSAGSLWMNASSVFESRR